MGNFCISCIRQALAGELCYDDKLSSAIVTNLVMARHSIGKFPNSALSPRELDVFRLIGKGYSTSEIGAELAVSARTVETYRARIKSKLRLNKAAELLRHAIDWVHGEGEK